MSTLPPRLLSGMTRPVHGLLRVPCTALHAWPAREELSLLDKAIGMMASFLCQLLPTGWILSHLDIYMKE